jgi:hypothetical protein
LRIGFDFRLGEKLMSQHKLVQLAQDLEWLGCEQEYYGHKHAMEGYPQAGPTWITFLEKKRGVLATCDKLERELKNAVRFDPGAMMGVAYPLGEALDAVGALLTAVETIKQAAEFAVDQLPALVRNFTRLVGGYLDASGARE